MLCNNPLCHGEARTTSAHHWKSNSWGAFMRRALLVFLHNVWNSVLKVFLDCLNSFLEIMSLLCETLNTNPQLLTQFPKLPILGSKWSSPLETTQSCWKTKLCFQTWHTYTQKHMHYNMRSIQNNTTKTCNKCCLWYSPSVLFRNLMYCKVQYNTVNNNKNNYSAPASRLWSGTGQRTSSTSQAILALAWQRG